MLRETSAAGDIFYGLKWDGAKLVADNPVSGVDVETAGDWAKKEFMENDLGSFVSVTRDGSNVDYIIDIDGQAAALVGGDGTDEDKQKAEDFLARNIGIKTSTDVS